MAKGPRNALLACLAIGVLSACWYAISFDSIIDSAIPAQSSFSGSQGSFDVDHPSHFDVYADGGLTCDEVTLTIVHAGVDEFRRGCSQHFTDGTLLRLGAMTSNGSGTYVVNASHDVWIVDEALAYEGVAQRSSLIWTGCGIGFLGAPLCALLWLVSFLRDRASDA